MQKVSDIFSKKKPVALNSNTPVTTEEQETEEIPEEKDEADRKMPSFVVVTKDFSGFGWAKCLQDEGCKVVLAYKLGDDDEKADDAKLIGKGILTVKDFDEVFDRRGNYADHIWLFDMNIFTEESTQLKEEGFRVFGGQELSGKMEHDRNYATEIMEEHGIESPPTEQFKSIKDGLAFMEKNPEKAYVFKPDDSDGSWSTFVPDSEKDISAHAELVAYMTSLGENGGTYILQERIKGVEANFEVWFFEGTPFFAFAGLECKRKLNHDYGENVGCAQDISFAIPLECKAIQETLGKLFPFYEEKEYTGFADVNVIISNNKPYFLEVCNRFGYNAHPNVFLALAKEPIYEILEDIVDGDTDDFYRHFKFGFGASITLYADHIKSGAPLYVTKEVEKNYYWFDGYEKDDLCLLSGYSNEIGIVTAHDFTIKSAAEECIRNTDKINFPNRAMRSDLDLDNYSSSPQTRYIALAAMKYFD